MNPGRIILVTVILLACVAGGFIAYELIVRPAPDETAHAVQLKIRVPGVGDRPTLVRADDGSLRYEIVDQSGTLRVFTPQEFAQALYESESEHPWWERVLNITTPWGIAWVAMGLIGQLAFTGRMIVQWLVSEKAKQSVVPSAFWWMSLIGASMLLLYFLWRRDVVGVLGQGTGWAIYARNLWLIYRAHRPQPASEDPAAEPTLAEFRE